jgi:hypothetical protein
LSVTGPLVGIPNAVAEFTMLQNQL